MEKLGGKTVDLKQKITNLRRQCNEYDSLLKHYSIQYMDLPPNIQKDLHEHAQFKRKLGLYAMDLVFLNEFYCTHTANNIEKKTALLRIKYKIEQIENALTITNKDLTDAKKFIENMRNNFEHVNEIDRVLGNKNREMEDLIKKKMQVKSNVKVDLDRIMMKIEQLTT